MDFLSFIIWDPSPTMVTFPEWLPLIAGREVRWYGLLFALGFLISQQVMFYMFRKEGKKESDVEVVTVVMMISTVIGARLGHVLFYEPDKYLPNPIKILYIWEGGLASHGAFFAIFVGLFIYVNYKIKINLFKGQFSWKKYKREGQSFLWIIDRIAIVVALTGCLIRLGNFMNSEIEGLPTGTNQGVVFARAAEDIVSSIGWVESVEVSKAVETETIYEEGIVPVKLKVSFNTPEITEEQANLLVQKDVKRALTRYEYVTRHISEPIGKGLTYDLSKNKGKWTAEVITGGIVRHPSQLYESFSYLIIFFILFFIWKQKKSELKGGWLFGLFMVLVFGVRFFYEFLKENQVAFEDELALNMGQWLSIPFVLIGVIFMLRSKKSIQGTGS
ncbi:MAG: prolipoprotein diacylglyceryl transferase [Bacteroidota bacterium]